jgi:hypothetical protein
LDLSQALVSLSALIPSIDHRFGVSKLLAELRVIPRITSIVGWSGWFRSFTLRVSGCIEQLVVHEDMLQIGAEAISFGEPPGAIVIDGICFAQSHEQGGFFFFELFVAFVEFATSGAMDTEFACGPPEFFWGGGT